MIPFWKITPGGNPTVLLYAKDVPVPRRAALSNILMDPLYLGCEQVGFIRTDLGALPRLDMMGGEFCLNATRAFALLLADQGMLHQTEPGILEGHVESSGMGAPVRVRVILPPGQDYPSGFIRQGTASVCLNIEESSRPQHVPCSIPGTLPVQIIRIPGITHLVLENYPKPEPSDLKAVCADLREQFGLTHEDAVGCLWLDTTVKPPALTPVVWVRETHSLCSESSCGSGSLACALALLHNSGIRECSILQPSGQCLHVSFTEEAKGSTLAWVSGPAHMGVSGLLDTQDILN